MLAAMQSSSLKKLSCAILTAGLVLSVSQVKADQGRQQIHEMAQKMVNNHPSMLAAAKATEAAGHDLDAAKSALYPVLGLSGGHTYSSRDATSGTVSPDTVSYGVSNLDLTLKQNLYAGGATFAQWEKSQHAFKAAEYREFDVAQVLALRATESHLNILRDRDNAQILEDSLIQHKRISDLVRKRARKGKEPKSSYSQAQSRVALMQAEYELANGKLRSSQAVYRELVGEEAAHGLIWPVSFLNEGMVDFDKYVNSNPGVQEARENVAAAREDEKASKADFLPTIDLELSKNVLTEGDSDYDTYGAGSYEDDYSIALTFNWDLELAGGNFSRNKASASRSGVALNNARDRVLGVRETLKVLLRELESAKRATIKHQEHADMVKNVVAAYWRQYEVGNRTLLDLLTVENEHQTARSRTLDSRYNELLLEARISRVGGRLTDVLGIQSL